MSNTTYRFNKTTEVNPIDRKSNFIEVNYDGEAIINQSYPTLGTSKLKFAREDVALFKEWLQSSTTGVFYAPYFDIILSKGINVYTVPLYLDMTDGFEYSNDGVEVSTKLYMSLSWLNDIVDAFTFESIMNAQEVGFNLQNAQKAQAIINTRTFYVPYVISTIPNYLHFFQGFMTVLSTGYMIYKETCTLVTGVANVAGIFTTVPAIIGLVFEIGFIVVLVVSLVAAIKGFVFAVIQPIKYHAAMMMADLLEAAALNMGLEFESSIFQTAPFNRLALLPEKYIPVNAGANDTSKNFAASILGVVNTQFIVGGYTTPNPQNQQGYPIITGGDLFRLAKTLVNGKILLQNPDTNPNVSVPTLLMERRDYVPQTSFYQLPDVREDWNGFNTKEFNATVIIRLAKDLNDKNTFDNYQGQILSAVTQPITAPDTLLVLTKGLREIEIEAARGIRKEQLTFMENLIGDFSIAFQTLTNIFDLWMNDLFSVINDIINAINDILKIINDILKVFGGSVGTIPDIPLKPISPPTNPYTRRIGMLMMEHDLVNVPKLLLMASTFDEMPTMKATDGSTVRYSDLDPLNSSIVNALYLWNQFYLIDNWVPYDWGGGYTLPAYTDQQVTVGIGNNWSSTPGPNYGTFSRPPGGDMQRHNQFTIWTPANNKSSDINKVSLSYEEYLLLANNNTFNDMNGDPCIVDSLGWHFEEGWMNLTYRKNEQYDTNLGTLITLPNGE